MLTISAKTIKLIDEMQAMWFFFIVLWVLTLYLNLKS